MGQVRWRDRLTDFLNSYYLFLSKNHSDTHMLILPTGPRIVLIDWLINSFIYLFISHFRNTLLRHILILKFPIIVLKKYIFVNPWFVFNKPDKTNIGRSNYCTFFTFFNQSLTAFFLQLRVIHTHNLTATCSTIYAYHISYHDRDVYNVK